MRAALYHPQYGYYTNLRGFGAEGDFITSPELHPAFGFLLARQALDVWEALDRPRPLRILELGGGAGGLAASLLDALRALAVPVEYALEEPSPGLRAHAQQRLAGKPVRFEPPAAPAHLVLANEVLDAQPVHRVVMRQGALHELCVGLEGDELVWIESDSAAPEVEHYFAELGMLPAEGAIAEVNTDLAGWVQALAERIERGLALILDYGYPAEALFRRPQGTLLTYYRHSLGSDPLVRLGRQDISVHVDFSTLARAAQRAGFLVAGVTSQRRCLEHLGIDAVRAAMRSPADRAALGALSDPHGLGRIGVLFLTRALPGFVPAGLSGQRPWPSAGEVPQLPAEQQDTGFLELWQDAFSGGST